MIPFQIQQKCATDTEAVCRETETRRLWRQRRYAMEWRYQKSRRYALWRFMKFKISDNLERLFEKSLKISGLYGRGVRAAKSLVVNRIEFFFPDLPAAFDGYRILHLTDPHLDALEDTDRLIAEKIQDLRIDLCVLTGDYRMKTFGRYEQILDPVRRVLDAVDAKDGIIGTLGNHDPHLLVDALEAMGMTVLVNETRVLSRGAARIAFTGLDDPHDYYTRQATEALAAGAPGFKIALVHTPELFDAAERNGYRLYLCGHTHGGQICLPGGVPIVTHLQKGKGYARGFWRYGDMIGYTNQGCGVVGIPVRFNSQSEVAIITLKRKPMERLRSDGA